MNKVEDTTSASLSTVVAAALYMTTKRSHLTSSKNRRKNERERHTDMGNESSDSDNDNDTEVRN
jgi:hypothetical protein